MNTAQINVKETLPIVKNLKSIINANTVLPILECAVLDFRNKLLKITVSDLETFATATMTTGDYGNFSFAIHFDHLLNALENCEVEVLKIKVTEDKIQLYGDDFSVKIPRDEPNNYPVTPEAKDITHTFQLKTKDFFKQLKIAFTVVSKDDLRPAMTGVQISDYNGQLTVCATDAHRLFHRSIEPVHDQTKGLNAILPVKFAKLATNIFKEDEISVDVNNNFIVFYDSSYRVIARLIDSRYPDWDKVVVKPDTEGIFSFFMKRKQLAAVLKFAKPYINRSNNQLKFSLKELHIDITGDDIDFTLEFAYKEIGRAHV